MSDKQIQNVEQVRAEMAKYDEIQNRLKELEVEKLNLLKASSECVKRVLAANGGVKRLRRNGSEMIIIVRGDTHFFRGGKGDITEI